MKTLFVSFAILSLSVSTGLTQEESLPPVAPAELPPVESPEVLIPVDQNDPQTPPLPTIGNELLPPPPPPVPTSDATDSPAGVEQYDLTLTDGRVLKGYRIHNWTKTTLTIFHSKGATSVPAHLLPDNVIKAYALDTKASRANVAAAKAAEAKKAALRKQTQLEMKALRAKPLVQMEGLVAQVVPGGIVLEVPEPPEVAKGGYQRVGGVIQGPDGKPVARYKDRLFGTIWVTNHPDTEDVVDGDRLRFSARVIGRHKLNEKTYRAVRFEKRLSQ